MRRRRAARHSQVVMGMQPITPHTSSVDHSSVQTIAPERLVHWLANSRSVVVLDVREPDEFETSRNRLPGARNIPLHQLFMRRDELPAHTVDAIVTVSNDGTRSRAAAFTLSLLGFTNVRSLEGGLDGWARNGLPLE